MGVGQQAILDCYLHDDVFELDTQLAHMGTPLVPRIGQDSARSKLTPLAVAVGVTSAAIGFI